MPCGGTILICTLVATPFVTSIPPVATIPLYGMSTPVIIAAHQIPAIHTGTTKIRRRCVIRGGYDYRGVACVVDRSLLFRPWIPGSLSPSGTPFPGWPTLYPGNRPQPAVPVPLGMGESAPVPAVLRDATGYLEGWSMSFAAGACTLWLEGSEIVYLFSTMERGRFNYSGVAEVTGLSALALGSQRCRVRRLCLGLRGKRATSPRVRGASGWFLGRC